MFSLRPNRAFQTAGLTPYVTPGKVPLASSRAGSLLALFLNGLRRGRLPASGRRATDRLGRSNTAPALDWLAVLGPDRQRIKIVFSPDEWLSPEENRQLLEMSEGAERMVGDLGQADLQLAALQAQSETGDLDAPDLAQTAEQTFARTDSEIQRWNIRADEIERAHDTGRLVPIDPPAGSLFAGAQSGRLLWQRLSLAPTAQPHRTPLPSPKEQRHRNIRADLQRLGMPTLRLRQHEIRIKAAQAKKLGGLRAQMNTLAKPRYVSGPLRQVTLARLAGLHEKVDHLAQEIHHHREKVGNRSKQRLDRHRATHPAEGLPPPSLTPRKKKGETV